MEIRGDQRAEWLADPQDELMLNVKTREACVHDAEARIDGAQVSNQNTSISVDDAASALCLQCMQASDAHIAFVDKVTSPVMLHSNSKYAAIGAQAVATEGCERSVVLKATHAPDALPLTNTGGSISSCGCEVMVDQMDASECTRVSSHVVQCACLNDRRSSTVKNGIIQCVSPTEDAANATDFPLDSIATSPEILRSSNQYALRNDLDESRPDSEDALVSSDQLTDSDRRSDSDEESDDDVSITRTSTDASSSEVEETSKSSSHCTADNACHPLDGAAGNGATSGLDISSAVSENIRTTNERRESDVDCEIDGDRVKFIKNVSLSRQNWDADVWNSPISSPKLTVKDIFAKIDKDFKAHALELKSFPLFSRRHSDFRLPPIGKLNLPRCPELRSLDYSPDIFSRKPMKLLANYPTYSEARSRSAESRVVQLRTTSVPAKEKFSSTPSLDDLPSYSNKNQILGRDKFGVSQPQIIPPWKTEGSQLFQPRWDLKRVSPSDDGQVKPKRGRILPIPGENRDARSELWHTPKKMKSIPFDVLGGDKSEVCLSSVGLDRVSNSSTLVRCCAKGSDFYRSHVETPGRPQYRRRTFSGRKRLSVPTKVAVVFPLRDAPCSDNNGDDSKTTTGISVGADVRPSSPGGELRPSSVCSTHTPSKPVSPAKAKALSSKHSSKHSSPIKTLSSTTVNAVPDIEHSDSLDSDDQSSRVSTGLGSLEVVVCPVQKTHHVGREIVNTVYGIPIDSLFTLLFTNSKMMLEVHALRKTTDLVASPWQSKDDGQQRLRQVTYTVALPTNSFGPKVSHVTEIQVMSELTAPGEYYSVDAEATNAGIPYAESFLVSNHWCLTRESSTETRLAVYTSVKYKKSMWGFMKSVIDKNSCSGVEGLLQGIDSALQLEVTEHANMRQRTRRRRRRGTVKLEGDPTVPLTGGALPVVGVGGGTCVGAVGAAKDKTKTKLPVNNILVNRLLGPSSIRSATLPRTAPLGSGSAALSAAWHTSSGSGTEEHPWSWPRCSVLFTTLLLVLLLLTNMLLFWRLTKLEEMVTLQPHYAALRGFMHLDPDIVRKEIRSDTMLQILQEQELSHVKMTEDWRSRISEAESLLHKAEGMLRGLHASIPADQSAASRTLLHRLRSASSVLQASIEGSNAKAPEDGPSLSFSFGTDIESDSSHSRREL